MTGNDGTGLETEMHLPIVRNEGTWAQCEREDLGGMA